MTLSFQTFWSSKKPWDKGLTILLLTIILITIASTIYILVSPSTAEKYTELYILGREGRTGDYPTEIVLGKDARVIVGIANYEFNPISYKLELIINDRKERTLDPIFLKHQEKWEQPLIFRPDKIGPRQKVEFRLYRGEIPDIYRSVYLWMTVRELVPASPPLP